MYNEKNFYIKSVSKNVNDIKITVDFKTELLGIIMILGNYRKRFPKLFNNYENQFYVDSIINEFSKFEDDEVIKIFDALVEKHSFNYDAPFCLFLQFDNNLEMDEINDYVKNRLNNDNEIYKFIDKIAEFSKRINFIDFYKKNCNLYQEMINNISGAFQKYNIKEFFKSYYGYMSDKEFIVNLTPFTTNGSYCCDLNDKTVSCFPIFEQMKKEKLYDSQNHEKYILQNPIHEFSHSYINPITNQYGYLNNTTHLFDNIREVMKKMAYPYDTHIINEHIIRAIEARYIKLIYNDEEWYTNRIEQEYNLGFIYIYNIINSLIFYENNRNIYPTFKDFYPEIIKGIFTDKKIQKKFHN